MKYKAMIVMTFDVESENEEYVKKAFDECLCSEENINHLSKNLSVESVEVERHGVKLHLVKM